MTSIIPSLRNMVIIIFTIFFYCSVRIDCLLFSINQFYGISFYFDFWSSRQARQNELSTDPGSFAFLEAKISTSILLSWSWDITWPFWWNIVFFRIFRASRPCFEGHKNDLREPWHLKNRVNAFSSVNRSRIFRQIDYTSLHFQSVDFWFCEGVIFYDFSRFCPFTAKLSVLGYKFLFRLLIYSSSPSKWAINRPRTMKLNFCL